MILNQDNTFKNFYLPIGNSKLFIFSLNTSSQIFDFSKAFTTYGFDFYLVFYSNDNLIIDEPLKQKLSNISSSRAIIWIDDLYQSPINECPLIFIDWVRKKLEYQIVFGKDDKGTRIFIEGESKVSIAFNSSLNVLEFDLAKNNQIIENSNGTETINEFNKFIIPFQHQKSLLGFNSKATSNNIGYLCFIAIKKADNSLQPKTALIIPNNNSKNVLFSYPYFDTQSYSQEVDILALIHPCLHENFDNLSKKFQSYLELFIMNDIKTNFIDEFGNNFTVPKHKTDQSFVSRITFVNSNKATLNKRSFFFMPQHDENLNLESSNGNYLLVGNSGTERQGKTKLVFHEYDDVLLTEKPNGDVDSSKYADSITSIPISPEFLTENNELSYYIDSEKTPLYDNEQTFHTLAGNTSREVEYKPIKIGTISKDTLIPIIPTLSFRNNPNLEELEKVLVKKRLINGNLINKSNSITPQGFLKEGVGLEFIKKQPNRKFESKLLKNGKSKSRFSITNIDLDFQTSISKEDVFFVTTPKLLQEAAFKDNFDIFFSIHSFDIDLILKNIIATDSERIIIFKYSRYTVEELLADTSKWSNYGKFRKTDLSIINQNIKNEFDVFEKKYNGGVNKDYEYIVQSVLRDRNWNGVFILNIPISDSKDLPDIFAGLISAQSLKANTNPNNLNNDDKRQFKTGLKFQYVAFPVNKTEINSSGLIDIKSTSYYGLIDYDLLGDTADKQTIVDFFPENTTSQNNYRFLLSKLLVRFENSEIRNFNSFAFLQVPSLFDDNADFSGTSITHDNTDPHKVKNLIRLEGNYQKNGASKDEFNFKAKSEVIFTFPQERTVSKILKDIKIKSLSFQYVGGKSYLFNIDADATFNKFGVYDIFNVGKINFKNIGLSFDINDLKISFPTFDLSSLGVFPDINFEGKGFLSSFPIKFSSFQNFQFPKIKLPDGTFQLELPDMDFFKIKIEKPQVDATWLEDVKNKFANLFSFVFDIDLGTLGDIEALKALKGQLLIGWSLKGGFAIGFKLNGPSTDGLHLDLFGAMKLDIERVDLCSFDNTSGEKTYFLRLIDARLTIFGKELPSKDDFDFNGIIYARPGEKIAWFIAATKKGETQPLNGLVLGAGQRVGPNFSSDDTTVTKVITKTKDVFNKNLDPCNTNSSPVSNFYKPDRNWLVASEDFIPKAWRDIFNLKFVFNDPALYGIYIQIVSYIEVDIIYKKLSENLGVYSAELQLDPSLRNQDFGNVAVTFPNLGVDIYTNGDFKVDIGYPRTSGDWSRSCLIQIRPFVGWGGFYFSKLKTASLSLFGNYLDIYPELKNTNILQAGFAFRIGIGAYKQGSMYYLGASISVYGIMEGAFAFNKAQGGLQKFIPDHFALRGRIGAIAELIGYVDFKVIKASIYVILRVEFGMLLAVINGKFQPIPIYIEGEVSISIRFKVGCFRIFRKKICIYIHLSFNTWVRFPYTLGGDSNSSIEISDSKKKLLSAGPIKVEFGEIPFVYIPNITKSSEGNYLIHYFAINFFGIKFSDNGKELIFSKSNILKDNIIRPIFSAILGSNSMNYSDLRHYFLGGNEGSSESLLDFTSFKPTLFLGYDETDENFLKNTYRLKKDTTIDEVSDFQNTIKNDPCSSNQPCPFRAIPIPISSCINVKSKNADGTIESFETDSKGFRIKFKGIFKNSTGNEVDIEKPIYKAQKNTPEAYSVDEINKIEKHFDSYMTQFLERPNTKSLIVPPKDQDIREDAIIPEYFKMLGLLSLESYFNFLSSKEANREKPNYNPSIEIDDLFTEKDGWSFNEHLEDIIGQLNYFYNNGLRLPDVLSGSGLTKSYYNVIEQTSNIQKINTNPDDATTDIVFVKHDDSISISLKDDMLSGDGLKDFVNKADEILALNLDDLDNDITHVNVDLPYQLIDVKLSISNSNVNTEDKAYRFFEIPNKVHKNLNFKKANLKVHIVSNTDVKSDDTLKYAACSNIEVAVKPHSIDGIIKFLELSNVYVDDLNLMHKIKANPEFIHNISIYLKTFDVAKNIIYVPLIKAGQEANTRLIKTNLSPRTHAPVIENSTAKMFALPKDNYVSNLTEKDNFTRILWEGITTNNGGFFLEESDKTLNTFNEAISKLSSENLKNIRIVFSFESEIAEPFYAFNNFIKISENVLSPRKIFQEIDNSSHSLYAEILSDNGDNIKEYHTKIPVHCFGFTVTRNKPRKDIENQYLPLEFEIKDNQGKTILGKDQILPLMPQHEKDGNGKPKLKTNDEIDDSKWIYNHISPLLKIDKDGLKRYDGINTNIKYNVSFGLRDTFGFRAIDLTKKIENYQHKYFDKLIPVNAWPFINISYWFKEYKNNELKFELKIKAFENSFKITDESLLQLKSDLSQYQLTKLNEISGKTFLSQQEFLYALIQTGVSLSQSEKDKILKLASEKGYQSFEPTATLESINTIIAQISDNNVVIGLDNNFIHSQDELKLKLLSSLNFVKTNLNLSNPKEGEFKVEFKLKVNSELKTQLNPTIKINRNVLNDLFVVVDSSVWEYETIKSISTVINIYNTKPEDSTIKLLNEAIKNANACPYVLGISSDNEKQKVVYLLNKHYLQLGTVESTPLERSSYFAIKPYSNKLWSDNYLPLKAGATSSFSNVDLDKGLNLILSKIDSLLTPTSVKEFSTDYLEKLISCKKLIVEDKFDSENNSELMNKTANIDAKGDTNQKKLRKEFRDLLFESLDNFYKYDGIIQLSPTNPNIDKLKDHRLSISIANQNDYTIRSSKIDFSETSPKWCILFDQIGLSKYVEFDILPKLTHIEFDINSENSSPEIEKSTWIQLVEPQDLLPKGKTISTKQSIEDKKWPRIYREFPDKPQIINYVTEQKTNDDENGLSWDNKLGEWQYKISIKDQYKDIDELKIFIKTISLRESRAFALPIRNFKGFIAYWSALLSDKTQKVKLEDFIDDLSNQLSLNALNSENDTTALLNDTNSFFINKDSNGWKVRLNNTQYSIPHPGMSDAEKNINILIGGNGFNLFATGERIKSITSEITAYRNFKAKNDEFVYVTETVSPSSWATPHIKFFTPIKIDGSLIIQDVLNKMKEINLPYKSTAKLLVSTADLEKDRRAKLPVIPVLQMEFKESTLPSIIPFDNIFKNYKNGYPSISLTIYNNSEDENDLPIFFANNIYKQKQ